MDDHCQGQRRSPKHSRQSREVGQTLSDDHASDSNSRHVHAKRHYRSRSPTRNSRKRNYRPSSRDRSQNNRQYRRRYYEHDGDRDGNSYNNRDHKDYRRHYYEEMGRNNRASYHPSKQYSADEDNHPYKHRAVSRDVARQRQERSGWASRRVENVNRYRNTPSPHAGRRSDRPPFTHRGMGHARTGITRRSVSSSTTSSSSEKSEEEELTEDQLMAKLMGVVSFESTKGQDHTTADLSGANKKTKRKYRQYMNRRGGFNRPLSPVF